MSTASPHGGPAAIDWERLASPGRVHTSLYTDPALFEQELERIFYGGWVWVAHDSEVARPGDFKSTMIGRQPVVVTRDANERINVLLNRCRHRATSVCEAEKGNARSLVCPYHGWTYALDGELRGVPSADGYEGILDRTQLSLVSLKTETYRGLVFASFNPDVEPLADYLGGARPWIDLFMDTVGAGFPLAVAGQHKIEFEGNWKIQLENTTDYYHFPIVHKSFIASLRNSEAARDLNEQNARPTAYCRGLGNGHSVAMHTPDASTKGRSLHVAHERLREQLSADCSPEQIASLLRGLGGSGFNLNLFPNIALSGSFLRELRPVSVEHTEVRHIAFVWDGAPAPANRLRRRMFEQFQGPAGFGSPDDIEVWNRVQRGARAGADLDILLNRGLNRETLHDGCQPTAQLTDETGMREAYAMWKRTMSR